MISKFELDSRKAIWENIFVNEMWGQYPSINLVKFISQNSKLKKQDKKLKILELGSATGGNLWYLARENFSIYAIEQSTAAHKKSLLKLNNEKVKYFPKHIINSELIDGLARFPDNYFDFIIDIECLSCNALKETESILNLCAKKLKINGLLFSQTFGNKSTGSRKFYTDLQKIKKGPLLKQKYARFINKKNIKLLYKQNQLELMKIEREIKIFSNGHKIDEWLVTCVKH